MRQYITELRFRYKGADWIGPIIEAESLSDAKRLMRHSPYKVTGEILASYREGNGDLARFVQVGGTLVIH